MLGRLVRGHTVLGDEAGSGGWSVYILCLETGGHSAGAKARLKPSSIRLLYGPTKVVP
jgi:hypothetical protein